MPLDKAKARARVNGARSHYRSGIHSEFINLLADDLEEALNSMDTAALESSRALNRATALERELDNEKTEYRKLRERSTQVESAIAVLREISLSPKGAQRKAAEQLKAMGVVEPAPAAPEKIEIN